MEAGGGGSMVVIGGTLTFTLELEDTELVNQPVVEVLWNELSLLAVTLAVNIVAAVVLRQEDDNHINRIIIWDCMINIMTMLTINAKQVIFSNAYICSIWMFFNVTLSTWNRLVPVAIVTFRYMLVCSAVQSRALE
jgi:hypothetical protein